MKNLWVLIIGLGSVSLVQGQTDSLWTLNACIRYALEENIQVRQNYLTNESRQIDMKQARAARYPSLSARASQNFNWSRDENYPTVDGSLQGSQSGSYGISSSLPLFNGGNNYLAVKRSDLSYESSLLNTDYIKENLSLSILAAYIQVLYAREQVENTRNQVEATMEQLQLSEERLRMSIISKSDYLQVKSELATEKYSLANAESQLQIARVNLMQLMELPVSDTFRIADPDLNELVNYTDEPVAGEIYSIALKNRPQIARAALDTRNAELAVKQAWSGYSPSLSLDASLSTGYSSLTDMYFLEQIDNRLNPSLSLSLSVPIYQRRQTLSGVEQARIGVESSGLEEINVRNQLRKDVEQACVDLRSAQIQYEAGLENYSAVKESYLLASEKFELGMINSVDFLFEKTNLISSESNLLQAKYNLIYSYKIVEFYRGGSPAY